MLRNLFFILLTVVFLAACRTAQQQPPVHPDAGANEAAGGVMPQRVDYERSRRFNELFLEAVRQKELEHIDATYELLDAALRIHPNASEAVYEMGALKLSFAGFSDSLLRAQGDSLLHRAVELEPGNSYYKEMLAIYLANNARYREAIHLYEEIAEAKVTYETLATLIWLYKTSGDYAGVIRSIERLERFDGTNEQLSMEKFQTYLAMNDSEQAYKAIEDLCAEYPLDLRYRVLLGDLYDQHGYHEMALDIYRDVLTAEPENSYAQISLLAYYKAAGADSLYLDYLQKVVLNPQTQSTARLEAMRTYAVDNIKAHADSVPVISLFQKALSQPQESRDMAELYAFYVVERRMPTDTLLSAMNNILRVEPDYTKARLQVLQIMLQRNDMKEVARICREGELYDPSEVTYYYYEGTALYYLGRNMEAIRVLQRGVERIDEQTDRLLASDVHALLGDVLHDNKLNEEAYIAYDKALTYNPLNLMCLNNYAYFLAEEGENLDKAEKMSRQTVEAVGSESVYLDTYAWILYKKKQYEQARIYIVEALRDLPETDENASIFDHAGDIHYRCAQPSKALEYWKKASSLTTDKTLKTSVQRKIRRRRI